MDQNVYAPAVPQLPCPVCSAPPMEREWRSFVSSGYIKIVSKRHSVIGSNVAPLICTQCGFVQLFVNPQDFK